MNVEAANNAVAQSIQALNAVMQNAQKSQIDFAQKLIKTNAEIKLGGNPEGIGQNIDLIA